MRDYIKEVLKEVLWFSYDNRCEDVLLTSSVIEVIRCLEEGDRNNNTNPLKVILFRHINRYMLDEPNGSLKWISMKDKKYNLLIKKDVEYIRNNELVFPMKWFLIPLINFNKLLMSIENEFDFFIYDIIFEIENEYRFYCNERYEKSSSGCPTPVLSEYSFYNDTYLKTYPTIPKKVSESIPNKVSESIPKKVSESIPVPPKLHVSESIPLPPKLPTEDSIPEPPKLPIEESVPKTKVKKDRSYKSPSMNIGEILKSAKGISLEEAVALRRKSMRTESEDESGWDDA